MSIPELKLSRKSKEFNGTWGLLTWPEAKLSLQTMELLWKENKTSISCIPSGRYLVKKTYSTRFVRQMYLVCDVPNRTGIRIHAANWPSQLNGCIALGTATSKTPKSKMLLNSVAACEQLDKALGGGSFYLTVEDVCGGCS